MYVVFHDLLLRPGQRVELPLRWRRTWEKVNGTVIAGLGLQQRGPGLAERCGSPGAHYRSVALLCRQSEPPEEMPA